MLAAGWMTFGFITIYINYQAQTDVKHRDSFSYEELLLAFLAGPIGSVLKLTSMRRSESEPLPARKGYARRGDKRQSDSVPRRGSKTVW